MALVRKPAKCGCLGCVFMQEGREDECPLEQYLVAKGITRVEDWPPINTWDCNENGISEIFVEEEDGCMGS